MLFIDGLKIDAEVTSEYELENDVTDHPVEVGVDVTDHSRPMPATLEIEGIVSDTPLGLALGLTAREPGSIPSVEALAFLQGIRERREPVPIVTSLRSYNLTGPDACPMMLRRLTVTRDSRTGKALRFRAAFKQIQFVKNERVIKRVSVAHAKGKSDKGNKPTTPVTVIPPKCPAVDTKRPPVRRVPDQSFPGQYKPAGHVSLQSHPGDAAFGGG